MSESTKTSILRRKAQIGQEQFQARAMTAARALRITLAKAAEDQMGLPLAAIGLTEARGPADPVLKACDDTTLLILLDSPGRGPGAALIDSALAGAVVQQQTTGSVTELRENAPPRKPTRTDAALIAPLLDSIFDRAGPLPDTTSQMQLLSGLRFGADIASTRLLGLALDADEYVHFSITVDIANGTRQGKLDLLLPLPNTRTESPDTEDEDVDPPATTLEPLVMSLNAQLRVALCRIRMPFSQLTEMMPGDLLPLPDGVMGNAEVLTIAGRKVAGGKLGQIDGARAVRLQVPGQSGDVPARSNTDRSEHMPERLPGPDEPEDSGFDTEMQAAALAEVASLPDLPDLPELPDIPDLPRDGAIMDVSDLPELPERPERSGDDGEASGESPDLPDLPEVPQARQA